jgi:glycosyltransferase involved in cell wall biosynthesis
VRIAHLTDCYLPRLGGIESQVHGLARRQRATGHEVTVLTATPGPRGERHGAVDDLDGVPVHRLAVRMPFRLPVNPFAPRDVRSILLSGRYDVAHVHAGVVSPFAYDAVPVVLDLGLPLVVTWHCMLGHTERLARWWQRLRGWSDRAVAFTAVSAIAAGPVRRMLGDEADVTVLPNGVDVVAWRSSPTVDRSTGEIRIVTAMRLVTRKRPVPLLHMLSRVRDRVPEGIALRLDIFGEGPAERTMRRVIRRSRMADWVDLPGRVTPAELRARYGAADLYVAPARLESFGIAALEARAAGLPVVARSDGGVREFVADGVEGLLAASDEEMVEAVARVASDSTLRQRISSYSRSHPPLQDWSYVLARADEEYARASRLVGTAS